MPSQKQVKWSQLKVGITVLVASVTLAVLIFLMSATGVLSIAFYFIPKDQVAWMFALQILIGLVLGPKSPLAFTMYADTADYNEWRTGRRATAMTFAAATFSQKLGTALAAAVMGWVFTTLGYVANTTQTPESQTGIVMLISFIPALFAFLAVGVMFFYKLDNQIMGQIQADLTERKAGTNTGVPPAKNNPGA